jgi:hypothetical protein
MYCGADLGCYYIVTHIPDTGQRLGKHIPEVLLSTIEGCPLLSNEPMSTHSWQQKTVSSVESVRRNYKRALLGEVKEYRDIQRSSGVVRWEVRIIQVECPIGRIDRVSDSGYVDCCNQVH